MLDMRPIPKAQALALCARIRQRNRSKWYTLGGLMCWGCTTFSKNDPEKMCAVNRPDCRGCFQVNARYDRP